MNFRDRQKGVAVVEFAVLLLLLLLILAGVVEFGFLWLQSHYITNAAREGARVAGKLDSALSADGKKTVRKAVTAYLSDIYPSLGVAGSSYATGACCEAGDPVISIIIEGETIALPTDPPSETRGYKATVTVKDPVRIFSGGGSFFPFLAPNGNSMEESAFFPCETICKVDP